LLVAVSLTEDVKPLAERRSHSCPNAVAHVGDPLVFLWSFLAKLAQYLFRFIQIDETLLFVFLEKTQVLALLS